MSSIQWLRVTKTRAEMHPDFVAELFANWRAGWSVLNKPLEITLRARIFNDEGFDIPEAIQAAKQQICADAARSVCTQFWIEFRIENSLKFKAGDKSTPPSNSSTPTP